MFNERDEHFYGGGKILLALIACMRAGLCQWKLLNGEHALPSPPTERNVPGRTYTPVTVGINAISSK